jgi:hypothetical protein
MSQLQPTSRTRVSAVIYFLLTNLHIPTNYQIGQVTSTALTCINVTKVVLSVFPGVELQAFRKQSNTQWTQIRRYSVVVGSRPVQPVGFVPVSATCTSREGRSNMGTPKIVIRACMLYEFKLGSNATASARKICQAFGTDVVNEWTV